MTNLAVSPRPRTCGAVEVYHRQLEIVPGFRERQVNLELFTARTLFFGGAMHRVAPIKIPVVVHVVYNTAAENISDAQVQSQIVVLNQDYRAVNPDHTSTPTVWTGLVADANIEFELTSVDPAGNATTGITRTTTASTSFSTDDSVKSAATGGADPWPSDKYLNIWVCSLGNGLLGYAQFPGGPVATDGVVILNTAFGTTGTAAAPFNLGRTTTHEVGHWLNLIHIWGDTNDCSGSDQVADTPTQQLPNFGKPTFPHVSCQNGPNGDMFMNYMDYVDDDTMVMFTQGQVQRMAATLAGPRASFVGP
jgi:hypothetical protein